MQPSQKSIPFINVRTQENRTPTGRRTSSPARRAALYYAFGRDKEAHLEGRQRGQWLGPDGRVHTQEEVMAWVRANALEHRYTFQGVLSAPEGELTAAEFGRAMQKGGQTEDWRLMAHEDTKHRHAHVLWFGDKRMDKKAFLSWQADVRAELVRLEQQHTSASLLRLHSAQVSTGAKDRVAQQEMTLDTGQARARAKGQEVGLG
ncbi:MAG TPA: hypothetical protein PLD25_32575 [Chloroflexota bacterium]|nr:hypothetical protein [Chloroflexota bacterium]HUM70496.1 hypothetical protein [Chloroflexota bacterium]